jgi:hypothetical protein
VALALLTMAVSAQLKTPTDWTWRTDTPARVTAESKLAPDTWHFVAMPPGWHVTMGPGGLLYPRGRTVAGNFVLQAEIFLFPGDNQNEYGLFLGGVDPEGVSPQYLAFVARRDGRAAVLRRAGPSFTPVVDWKANDAVLAHPGGSATAKNVLRVDVGAAEVVFTANGKDIATLPRAGLAVDGVFGFRVGKDLNLHITTLDVTERLAPVPVKKATDRRPTGEAPSPSGSARTPLSRLSW